MSRKTKRTLNIKPSEIEQGEFGMKEDIKSEESPDLSRLNNEGQSLFDAFPQIAHHRKTETLSIRLTRDLSDKLQKIRSQTGMSTSTIVYEILDKSIDEVMRVNGLSS